MKSHPVNAMNSLCVSRNKTTNQQEIATYFRRKIRSGQLPPGEKLPTQRELAEELGVSGTTVHFAFQALIEEGLLVGRRALGTFVADRQPGLRQVGLCYFGSNYSHPEHLYLRALHQALQQQLQEMGVGMPVFQQTEWDNGSRTLSRELVEAVNSRTLDGLIVPSTNPVERDAVEKLGIPVAYNSSGNYANCVKFNVLQFLDLAFAEVAAAGCRSVGLISALSTNVLHKPKTGIHDYVAFTRHFVELAGNARVSIKKEWTHCPENETVLRGSSHEEYGYENTRRLLAQPELPESLIVYSDALARGAIIALLAEQEKAKTMTLILHKNEGVPLICPLPATYVVSSAADNAQGLLKMIDRQFHAQPPGGPVHLPFKVEKHTLL